MTRGQRVSEARAYVDQARPRHDVLLPASVLTRMFYELRRHAIGLLAVIDERAGPAGPALALSASWEAILGQALADAIQYRDPAGTCADCDKRPAGLCADHAGDLDRTDAYLGLARQLGIEVER